MRSISRFFTRGHNRPWFAYRETVPPVTTGMEAVAFLGDPAQHRVLPAFGAAAIPVQNPYGIPDAPIRMRRAVGRQIQITNISGIPTTQGLINSSLIQQQAAETLNNLDEGA